MNFRFTQYFSLPFHSQNGVRTYAQAVIESIDPNHQLFGSRVIARDDVPDNSETNFFNNFLPASKDISFVLPGLERLGVVVDDSVEVWKDRAIVLHIPKFCFWRSFLKCYETLERENIRDETQRRQKSGNEWNRWGVVFEAVGWIINNDSMNIVKDTLVQIHQQFYARAQQRDTGVPSTSVGEVIGQLRASLFRNTLIYFDETFSKVASFFVPLCVARSEVAVSLLACQADGRKVPLSIDCDDS